MTVLLAGFYQDADPDRRAELLECVRRNVANDLIEAIHLFVEEPIAAEALLAAYPELATARIRLIEHGRRLTYRDLFGYANRQLPGQRVIVANADIYFDHTLARLDGYDLSDRLLCLSRWDVQADGSTRLFDHAGSQDAWVFRAPLPDLRSDFHLGVLGCDNRLAWEADHAGLTLSNPARSVRAHHLHLSQVRRYNAGQWLPGPTRSVPAELLGTPWLWFVVPCMGRLDDLRRTVGSLLAQPRSSYVLVDYSSPDGAGEWARQRDPRIVVATVGGRACFRGAEARNRGAGAVDDDGIICFLDADVAVAAGFSAHVLDGIAPGSFLVPDSPGPGLDTALVCRKSDFDRVLGFDELFQDWGEECADLKAALRRSGLAERSFPASLLAHGERHDRTAGRFRSVPDRAAGRAVHAGYRRAKAVLLEETGGTIARPVLRELYRAVARRYLSAPDGAPVGDCAAVAFRESMGYAVGRLTVGVSSHRNELRPFRAIPEPLDGLAFTQVVASSVSQVEVEFLTDGRLFVLVGDDWEGHRQATAWLRHTAIKDDLPVVGTECGTGFEVWSLLGEAGECFVLPTQVMLVADRLVDLNDRIGSAT
jgi:hypothetical protein